MNMAEFQVSTQPDLNCTANTALLVVEKINKLFITVLFMYCSFAFRAFLSLLKKTSGSDSEIAPLKYRLLLVPTESSANMCCFTLNITSTTLKTAPRTYVYVIKA